MTDNAAPPFIRSASGYRVPIILSVQFIVIAGLALITAYVILPRFEPVHQGYICNDPSLKYKYYSNTIDISIVHLTGYFLIIISIFLIECRPFHGFTTTKICPNEETPINDRLVTSAYAFFASQLGLSMNFLLYQLVKYSCGRLRPHFFDVCRPNADCVTGSYVDSYVCTGHDKKLIRDAHLSFYSGHAATAFYYATFLTIYTQIRLRKRLLHCLPTLYVFNVLLYAAASFVALSRIIDNKHHNGDVIFGCCVGIIIGVTVIFAYLVEVLRRLRFKTYVVPESVVTSERRRFQSAPLSNETSN